MDVWASLVRGWRRVRRRKAGVEVPFEPDVALAGKAADQAARRRGGRVTPVHLLFGLLRTEPFMRAIEQVGGDVRLVTEGISAALDRPMDHLVWRIHSDLELTLRQQSPYVGDDALVAITSVATTAVHQGAPTISVVDLWACLSRTGAGTALANAGIDPYDVLFVMVHGAPPQDLSLATARDVEIVFRNDKYSTFELVELIFRTVFELPAAVAAAQTANIHNGGSAAITRLPLAKAREQILAARAIARDKGMPLWIGVDDHSTGGPYR